jgi:hypothetical protein
MAQTLLDRIAQPSRRTPPGERGWRRTPGVDPAMRGFYAEDPRRAASAEVDLGLRWRGCDGSTYRAAWIEATGELYSVRHGEPSEGARLSVIARLAREALERRLAGWRAVNASDRRGSYEWLLERVGAARPQVA